MYKEPWISMNGTFISIELMTTNSVNIVDPIA